MEVEKKGWWSQRTSLEKTLTAITVVGAIVSISLLVSLIVVIVNNNNGDDDHDHGTELDEICLDGACVMESSRVLAKMNQQADPCDNFFEFACGNFLKETVIPDDKTSVTAFSVIDNQLKEQLRAIVTEPIQITEIEPFQNLKRLYQACLNTDLIDSRGRDPVLNVLNTMGGWPVVQGASWAGESWTWQQSAWNARLNGYSVSSFLSFSVSTDNKDSTKRIIRIDQASLGLSREYLIEGLDEPFVRAYYDYQVNVAVEFGAARALAEVELRQALDFETELAQISMAREDRRDADKLYNPMTIAELQLAYNYAGHNWLNYFNSLLPAESQLTSSDIIIVGATSFFEQLGELLARTSNRVLANYVMSRHALSSISYLSKEFRDLQQDYTRQTTGRTVENPRWLDCVNRALDFYPHAFGALYVRKHFNEAAKEMSLEMVNNIKDEFKIMLSEIEWMDPQTKAQANEKANTISEQIAYADELLDDAKLDEYYQSFAATVNVNEYYESIFRLNEASTNRNNRRLREPIDKNEWTSFVAPAIVNAFYSSLENSIKFPAGILQGAFFNAERPQYMNYGGIGFVIGHEITHGFDDQGSQYDAFGNLRNWWAEQTRSAYLEKAQCIIDQYGNYTEPLSNLNLNGFNTQGENIADNGGIKESYRAYNRWAENNPEPKMPGLNYTPKQMFWISAGQIWCSTYREETIKNQVTTGVHSPGQFRVIGPMSNLQEFANDFQCDSSSKMNPPAKCEVW